jgi:hypothetical protein
VSRLTVRSSPRKRGPSGPDRRGEIEASLRLIAPRMPAHELGAVMDHALDSSGLCSASAETAAWLSLIAYARHALTEYDELLAQGYDRDSARHFVAEEIDLILARWGVTRRVQPEE